MRCARPGLPLRVNQGTEFEEVYRQETVDETQDTAGATAQRLPNRALSDREIRLWYRARGAIPGRPSVTWWRYAAPHYETGAQRTCQTAGWA